jgi:circadian clock protein KaiB
MNIAWKRKGWHFQLFIAGNSPVMQSSLKNLDTICSEYLHNDYKVEVIDLNLHPELAEADNIVIVPTLIRDRPLPKIKMIGDLSNNDEVIRTLKIE